MKGEDLWLAVIWCCHSPSSFHHHFFWLQIIAYLSSLTIFNYTFVHLSVYACLFTCINFFFEYCSFIFNIRPVPRVEKRAMLEHTVTLISCCDQMNSDSCRDQNIKGWLRHASHVMIHLPCSNATGHVSHV